MKTTARVTPLLLLRESDAIGYAKFYSRSHAAVILDLLLGRANRRFQFYERN
jgi:hypothetical protein